MLPFCGLFSPRLIGCVPYCVFEIGHPSLVLVLAAKARIQRLSSPAVDGESQQWVVIVVRFELIVNSVSYLCRR